MKKSLRMKNKKLNNRGMTMVEVILGFVILMIVLGLLSGIIAFASNLYHESVALSRAQTELSRNMYKKEASLGSGIVVSYPNQVVLKPQTGMPGAGSSIPLKMEMHSINSQSVLTGEYADELDINVFYFAPKP